MVGMGLEKAEAAFFKQRQRPDVDAVVVVGQLQSREHAADQSALSAAGVSHDADEPVIRMKIDL